MTCEQSKSECPQHIAMRAAHTENDRLRAELSLAYARIEKLQIALGEIARSNNSKWQSDRADKALMG